MKSSQDNVNKPQKGIHSGHRQRVKERFLKAGIDSFQSHEALEFLLFFGVPYKDTNPIAHTLIEKYGSLAGVFDAPIESLKEVSGVTENAAVLIKALPDIARLYLNDKLKQGVYLGSLHPCVNFLKTLFSGLVKEEFYILLLDNQHRLIHYKKLAIGNVKEVYLDARTVQEEVFLSHATNVILAHNHPSGDPSPSKEDLSTTKYMFESLAYIKVNLLDHVIVSNKDNFSFSRAGYIDKYKDNCAVEFAEKFSENSKKWLLDD